MTKTKGAKKNKNNKINNQTEDNETQPDQTNTTMAEKDQPKILDENYKDILATLLANQKLKDKAAKEQIWKFWKSQPVPALEEDTSSCGVIGQPIINPELDKIRKEPYKLANQGFEWSTLDVLNTQKHMDELYELLNENYVEDDDAMFRFAYTKDFLKWALMPPGYDKTWHCGVRVKSSQKLVGFISGVPATMLFSGEKECKTAEINFLCIHKQLRDKRLAPVLIKEVTRRINLTGVYQAVYTAGAELPKPISKARYYHRSINIKKLLDVKFIGLHRRQTVNMLKRLYKLPEKQDLEGFRVMTEADIPQVHKLLEEYLSKMRLAPKFTEEEFKHWLLPRKNIVYSYVVQSPTTNQITDFGSFYSLPSTVMTTEKHNTLYACYSYYNVISESTGSKKFMHNMLVAAKMSGFDVYNALEVMDNKDFLEELKFGSGDGELHYYLYNWKIADIPKEKLGLVLL